METPFDGIIASFLRTYGIGFLAGVGLITLLVLRKRIIGFITGADAEEAKTPHRRRADMLLHEFIEGQKDLTKVLTRIAEIQNSMVTELKSHIEKEDALLFKAFERFQETSMQVGQIHRKVVGT